MADDSATAGEPHSLCCAGGQRNSSIIWGATEEISHQESQAAARLTAVSCSHSLSQLANNAV